MDESKIAHEEVNRYLTRGELARRWRCSGETIKRRDRAGVLHPVRFGKRKLLYALAEVEELERAKHIN